jgi:hypothetical protein
MAVAFGAVGSIPTSGTFGAGSVACPYPTGIVAGSPLVLFCKMAAGTGTWNTPSGWTLQQKNNNILSELGVVCFTKSASGSETGTLTVSAGGTAGVEHVAMLRYTGNNPTTLFGGSALAVNTSNSTTSPVQGTVSPGANDMVVRCYCWGQATGATGGTLTFPTGTAWTSRLNFVTGNGSSTKNCGCVIVDKIAGTDTQTVTANSTGAWGVIDIIVQAPVTTNPAQFMPFFR